MRALQALMMMLGALAVLMTGVVPANAGANATSRAPCHEATMHHDGSEAPSPAPGKAVKAMDCCIACVTPPTLRPPERARPTSPQPAEAAPLAALPLGERPAPEPHPPRPILH